MAYVVADPCVKCKYTDCVAVCPVDCFYEGKNSLAINPDECIDCGACEPECPTTAIFEESELPAKWAVYKDLNAIVSGAKDAGDVDTQAGRSLVVAATPVDSFKAGVVIDELSLDVDAAELEEWDERTFLVAEVLQPAP